MMHNNMKNMCSENAAGVQVQCEFSLFFFFIQSNLYVVAVKRHNHNHKRATAAKYERNASICLDAMLGKLK